jgi:hypothetical protein
MEAEGGPEGRFGIICAVCVCASLLCPGRRP